MADVITYKVRKTTDAEIAANMPYITSSMLEAVNTCPKWGIIRNVLHKTFVTGYRSMALEAGSVMHDVLASLNLYQVAVVQKLPEHADYHGRLLFRDRWDMIWGEMNAEHSAIEKTLYSVIGSSDFYDDPNDKNRTVANLEHAAMELLDYWSSNLQAFDIYVADPSDPTADIGIEHSLDVVFEITVNGVAQPLIRVIGLADILYYSKNHNRVTLGEYKTTSSMQDSWREAFRTRHQITIYFAALPAYFSLQHDINEDVVLVGSAIPVRKTSAPVQHFPVTRYPSHVEGLIRTMLFTREVIDRFIDNPLNAPMFTHSCSRFFRPCPQLDLCDATMEDQEAMFSEMITTSQLSPSEAKALLRRE